LSNTVLFMKRFLGLVIAVSLCLAAQRNTTVNAWTYNGVTNQAHTTTQTVLNKDELSTALHSSPILMAGARSNTVVAFPTPGGKIKDFRMFSSPVMPTSLAQKYPDIQTYTGIGLDNPSERVSVTTSKSGI